MNKNEHEQLRVAHWSKEFFNALASRSDMTRERAASLATDSLKFFDAAFPPQEPKPQFVKCDCEMCSEAALKGFSWCYKHTPDIINAQSSANFGWKDPNNGQLPEDNKLYLCLDKEGPIALRTGSDVARYRQNIKLYLDYANPPSYL